MEDRDMRQRSGMPLTHIVIALFLAAIASYLYWMWQSKKATASASAELLFNSAVTQQADPDVMQASQPAVALADSILNDEAIAGLAKRAQLVSTSPAGRIGEFRSGLQLTQPSATVLMVRFVDEDANRSAANANAVAEALAAWTPHGSATPAATADAQAATTSIPAAPPAPSAAPGAAAEGQSQENQPAAAPRVPNHALSDALGGISAQLTATGQELDRIAEGQEGVGSQGGFEGPTYKEFREQRLLRTQVNAAEEKLDEVRAQYEKEGSGTDAAGSLTNVEQALRAILRGGAPLEGAGSGRSYGDAGISDSRLQRERGDLNNAIGVVNRARAAVEQTENAQASADDSAQAAPQQAAAGAAPGAAATTPAPTAEPAQSEAAPQASQPEQTPPADGSGASAEQQTGVHPLSVVRTANPPEPVPLWRAIVAGSGCGLFYLGCVIWDYRRTERDDDYEDDVYEDDDDEEEMRSHRRLVTPDVPVRGPREDAADGSGRRAAAAEEEDARRQRKPFSYSEVPDESAVYSRADFHGNNEGGADVKRDQDDSSAAAHEDPFTESRTAVPHDESMETDDAMIDQLRKSLSQTEIGKMFEGSKKEVASVPGAESNNDRKQR